MKFRKKSIEIQAVLWDGTAMAWQKLQYELGMTHKDWEPGEMGTNSFYIHTSEGKMKASKGDYIIKEPFDKERKFYPCKPGVFEQTYEEVE